MQTDFDPTIARLFAKAIEIEYMAARFYEALTDLFPHMPGIAVFWRGLTADEMEHALILEETRKRLTPEQIESPADPKMWKSLTQIHQKLSKNLIEEIETLDDAYELAHDLEFSEVNAIFQFLTTECIPHETRIEFVRLAIQRHQSKLLDFTQNYGDKAWRKDIRVQRG